VCICLSFYLMICVLCDLMIFQTLICVYVLQTNTSVKKLWFDRGFVMSANDKHMRMCVEVGTLLRFKICKMSSYVYMSVSVFGYVCIYDVGICYVDMLICVCICAYILCVCI